MAHWAERCFPYSRGEYYYDEEGYDYLGYNKEGYNRKGYDKKGFNKENKVLMENKLVINMDCVGLGNNVLFISKKDAMKHNLYSVLKDEFNSNEKFNVKLIDFFLNF